MSQPPDKTPFTPAVVGFLVASVVAIFAISVVLATLDSAETPSGATSASPSAIGHKGFYTLLERLELPVSKSRVNGEMSAGPGGLLIVDEPDPKLMSSARSAGLNTAPNVLLVLPKWSGQPDVLHDGWVAQVGPIDPEIAKSVLATIDKTALIVRGPAPARWIRNVVGATPTLDPDVQLIAHSSLKPLIGTADQILLGEFTTPRRRVWVLADPSPLENHGLAVPTNTRFALALVSRLRRNYGRIVFDETVHGIAAPERNPIQLLFKFPFVIVTVQILVALGLLLLATTARFGGAEVTPPPFPLGKIRLIDNIASLMDRAGHQAIILRRYISVRLADAARALHAPPGLDDDAQARWLDRVGDARGIGLKAVAVLDGAALATGGRSKRIPRLFNEARDIYSWTQVLLRKDSSDGSRRRQDNR